MTLLIGAFDFMVIYNTLPIRQCFIHMVLLKIKERYRLAFRYNPDALRKIRYMHFYYTYKIYANSDLVGVFV